MFIEILFQEVITALARISLVMSRRYLCRRRAWRAVFGTLCARRGQLSSSIAFSASASAPFSTCRAREEHAQLTMSVSVDVRASARVNLPLARG